MKKLLLGFVLVAGLPFFSPAVMAEALTGVGDYAEGVDYERIMPPLPGAEAGSAEVMEFFWYGCPHCYQFEPTLHAWEKSKSENVKFVRVPAVFNNPTWKLHAQAFYTAEVLGVFDTIHKPLFDAMHEHKRRINTEDSLQAFFADYGVSEADFRKTFNSFAVQTKVRRAADLSRRSGITGVPAIVVNGKYRVTGNLAGSHENMIKITDALAAAEAGAGKVAKSQP